MDKTENGNFLVTCKYGEWQIDNTLEKQAFPSRARPSSKIPRYAIRQVTGRQCKPYCEQLSSALKNQVDRLLSDRYTHRDMVTDCRMQYRDAQRNYLIKEQEAHRTNRSLGLNKKVYRIFICSFFITRFRGVVVITSA